MENQEPVVVIEQQEERKRKGALAVILAIAFVAILGIGGTFAYMTWTTNQTPNRMTVGGGVTADLLEPTWTNAAAASAGATEARKKATASDGEYIPLAASTMAAGSTVAKNPFVVNTSKSGNSIYAGMKLQFQKWVQDTNNPDTGSWQNMSDDEMGKLLACYAFDSTEANTATKGGITLDADGGWAECKYVTNTEGAKYFYNTKEIKSLSTSSPAYDYNNETTNITDAHWGIGVTFRTSDLFTHVHFMTGASKTDVEALNEVLNNGGTTKVPGWRVVISGAAIQYVSGVSAEAFDAKDGVNWKSVCDAMLTSDGTSATAKPGKATGVRAGASTQTYTPGISSTITNTGVGEVSQVKPDGTTAAN